MNANKYIGIWLTNKGNVRIEGRQYKSDRKRDDGNEVYLELSPREWCELRDRIAEAFSNRR